MPEISRRVVLSTTVVAAGAVISQGVTVPPGAFLSRQYTQRGSDANVNTSPWQPTGAITAAGCP